MISMAAQPDLAGAVATVRDRAAALRLGLEVPGADDARRSRDELVGQLDDYLLPRLGRIDAPLLAVVGGSTGAGKSTLVNSLVGARSGAGRGAAADHARAGAGVPARRRAVVHGGRVLPGLARRRGQSTSGERRCSWSPTGAVPAGLALLDAPDIDSVVAGNRELAAQLLAAADLWMFVTTAARYADAVPWELLRDAPRARHRAGASCSTACRRRRCARSVAAPRPDAGRERARRRAAVRRARGGTDRAGSLPADGLRRCGTGCSGWPRDAAARAEVVRRDAGRRVAQHVRAGAGAGPRPRTKRARPPRRCCEDVGRALRGRGAGRRRRRPRRDRAARRGAGPLAGVRRHRRADARAAVPGRPAARPGRRGLHRPPAPDEELADAVESGVESLVRGGRRRGRRAGREAWRGRPGGAALLGASADGAGPLVRDFAERPRTEVRAWQGDVLDLVRSQGAERRTAARMASFGVNGAGLAGDAAGLRPDRRPDRRRGADRRRDRRCCQKMLEAVFGDRAVRALATQARHDLLERVREAARREAGGPRAGAGRCAGRGRGRGAAGDGAELSGRAGPTRSPDGRAPAPRPARGTAAE